LSTSLHCDRGSQLRAWSVRIGPCTRVPFRSTSGLSATPTLSRSVGCLTCATSYHPSTLPSVGPFSFGALRCIPRSRWFPARPAHSSAGGSYALGADAAAKPSSSLPMYPATTGGAGGAHVTEVWSTPHNATAANIRFGCNSRPGSAWAARKLRIAFGARPPVRGDRETLFARSGSPLGQGVMGAAPYPPRTRS
jgi:hypothetical protein